MIKEKKKRKVKKIFKIEAQKNPTRTLQLCVFFKEKLIQSNFRDQLDKERCMYGVSDP